jgi:hypothetical protein
MDSKTKKTAQKLKDRLQKIENQIASTHVILKSKSKTALMNHESIILDLPESDNDLEE